MSDQNPPGGSGEPPEPPNTPAPPPGNYPAFPPGSSMPRARPKDTWKIWLGIGLAIPVLIAGSLLAAGVSAIDSSGAVSGLVGLAMFLGPFVLLVPSSTRKFALGLLIAYAVLLILAAGACVALLAAYN
jgi:hypothetical protein